ncbi:MAG: hypothetical protein P4L83_23025, partial [Nevskia sp.]|nr:hypothetical protein [Nevskia sp.]
LAYHDQVLHTASMIALLMIAAAFAGLLLCWLRGRLPGGPPWSVPLALVPVAVILLQLYVSRPVWNLLPELRFLQFPWRWLVVLEAPMAIFVTAAIWPRATARRIAISAACAALFLAMTAYAARNLFQPCDDEDAVLPMLEVYRSGAGFIGTYEYEPIGADNALVATNLPESCFVRNPAIVLGKPTGTPDTPPAWDAAQATCEATFTASANPQPEHLRIAATTPHPGFLILRLRRYPAWQIRVNGRPPASLPARKDGLIAVPVPQGKVEVAVDWTATPDAILARWLSGLGVLALAALCFLPRRHLS